MTRFILSTACLLSMFVCSTAEAGPLQGVRARLRSGDRTPVVNAVRLVGKVPLPQIQIAKAVLKGIANR
jgi:hypothetical protein